MSSIDRLRDAIQVLLFAARERKLGKDPIDTREVDDAWHQIEAITDTEALRSA
jgi:hypothetical protein